jgi:serine O-acetyltransferase
MRNKLKADLFRMYGEKINSIRFIKMLFTHSNLQCLVIFRLQEKLYEKKVPLIPSFLKYLNQFFTGAEIGIPVKIGKGLIIRHTNGIVLGNGAIIGENCTLLHQVTLGEKYGDGSDENHSYPVIGDNVVVSCGAKVLGGITIGNNVVIGANAVVLKDVGSDSVAVGVPAKNIKKKD